MTPLVPLGALAIGATLGMLGGGGTVLTVPLVRALLGLDTRHAIALSLPVVAVAAGVGSLAAWRDGRLAIGPALALAGTTSVGAWLAAQVAQALSSDLQSWLLGVTLLAASALTLMRAASPPAGDTPPATVPPATATSRLVMAAAGLAIGALTGLVGVGGGFLIVPVLVSVGRYPLTRAVPVSLFVIACSATTAAIGYRSVAVDLGTVALMAVTAAAGVVAGGAVGRRIAPAPLQRIFAALLATAAVYVFLSL